MIKYGGGREHTSVELTFGEFIALCSQSVRKSRTSYQRRWWSSALMVMVDALFFELTILCARSKAERTRGQQRPPPFNSIDILCECRAAFVCLG